MSTYMYMGYRNQLRGKRDPKEEHLATMRRNLLDKKPYLIWHHVSPQAVLRKQIHPWKLRKYLCSRSNMNAIFKAKCRDGSSLNVEGIHLFDPDFVPCKDHLNYREEKKNFELRHQSKKELVNRLKQEVDILSKLQHKNVVKYYGMDMGESDIFVFSESSSTRTSVRQYHPMEEIRVSLMARDILNGLSCLHSNNLAHRELCCVNIFIQKDGSVKIGNISWIKRDGDHDMISYVINEPEWQLAPEVLHEVDRERGAEADIWNLGTTLLKMLVGHRHSWPKYYRKTIRKSIEELFNVPDHLSDNARDFIRRCFEPDPSKRPSAKELLVHPFVNWFEHRHRASSSPELIQIDDSEEIGKF